LVLPTSRLGLHGKSVVFLSRIHSLRILLEDHEFFDEESKGAVLSSYLGLDTRVHQLTVLEESIEAKPGQALLLCSDGLYKQMSEMQLVTHLRNHLSEPQKLLEQLCHEASKVEYSDNITIVLVLFENP
jgi:serine/threonine protein phosphatase PrpC